MAHKYFGLNDLREMFLAFFETKEHLRLPSASLIPQNDPSLLLINSGMAPMKPWFTGEAVPPCPRVCTCQKCIRTGDIENIGKTARHGTYFEMLGNFSFGDYFKTEAIDWCWEFLTSPDWVGLEPELLYPSVYLEDDEAFDLWNGRIGVPAERITRLGKADNFWEHGAGPCGPCSEVYYDRGAENGCGSEACAPGCDCDRFMEVWNNVFTQFNNDGSNNYTELSQKNIDTGMGLERLACVCQNVGSLFEVDTVMNITNKVSERTGAHYGESVKGDISLRVITDHIRSGVFMICDGVLPSNEGRGYVLRRLLRRAARHGKLLGVNDAFLFEVVETVVQKNERHYPELREKYGYIVKVVKTEEDNFAKTIDSGMKIFSEILSAHAPDDKVFSGADAFKLYDTYGFPIDITIEMLEEHEMMVDMEAFGALMQAQRERARAARGDMSEAWKGLDLGLDNTPTEFGGYEKWEDDSQILAIVVEGEASGECLAGQGATIVLDKTPFYAEMGGQSADHGELVLGESVFEVDDVQKTKGGKYLHSGSVRSGAFRVDDKISAKISATRRRAIMRAHSATHLLHKALCMVLGEHVQQAGSLVEPDRLRFDFTHFSAMEGGELSAVERIVNEAVLEGYAIDTREMSIDAAREKGATALFGEKYGDVVRVVDMDAFSVELCGGTHLDNTAKVGSFRISSEFSVASGVRRIEAITGFESLAEMSKTRSLVFEAAEALKAKPGELCQRIASQAEELRTLRQSLERFASKESAGEAERFLLDAKSVGDFRVLTAEIPGADADSLRKMGDVLRERSDAIVAVLTAVSEGKITFLAVCGKNAVKGGIKAGDIIKEVTAICGGRGGGKPDSAMGGGSDTSKLAEALSAVEAIVSQKI